MGILSFSATVENAQNLYPHFSFTIVIVFIVVQKSIKYRDNSKFHYRPALLHIACYYVVAMCYI